MTSEPYSSRRELTQVKMIVCGDCRMQFRLENLTPYTTATRLLHCPACGSVEVKDVAVHPDKWYALAVSFGLRERQSSAEFIQELYKLWNPEEFELFRDFVSDALSSMNEQSEVAKD